MRGWLLDSNVLIDITSGRSIEVAERYTEARIKGAALFLSSISVYEYRSGAERNHRRDFELAGLARFLEGVEVIDFNAEDAAEAALIRAQLMRQGRMIGGYDLLIAGQARARDMTLVTANTREFARVQELHLEDWTLPQSA